MLLSRDDCLKRYGSDYLTAKQVAAGNLFQLERGIWSDLQYVPEQAIVSFKYPKAILTMLSAFYHYGLTDVIPEICDLATDRDAAKIKDRRVHQIFIPREFLEVGAETDERQGYQLRIYNRERMLIELLRFKHRMPYDYYKEILTNYRQIITELQIWRIQEYAAAFPKSGLISRALAEEVF